MSERTIWGVAKKDRALGLDKFAKWVDKAGMENRLDSKKGEYTVFAPNDAAINTLSPTDSAFFWAKNDTAMSNAVKYHVLSGRRLMASDLMQMDGQMLTMDNGLQLPVKVTNGKVMVGNANVVDADHMASNGVIHVVDAVLLINKMMPMTSGSPTSTQQREQNTPMSAPTPMGTYPADTMNSMDTMRMPRNR
ncbi:MAG TPA: fasciclin domain-containing protein [bacterium]|jgi:uncharacterized surface protein with fasciclin (FAS1) repeats